MTPTISPNSGALPLQPAAVGLAPVTTNPASAPAPAPSGQAALGASPATTVPGATTATAALQATSGIAAMTPDQLVPLLQEVIRLLTEIATILQQQAAVTGGGGVPGQLPTQTGCGCAGGAMGAPTTGGAMGAPTSASETDRPGRRRRQQRAGSGRSPAITPTSVQRVDASSVSDKASLSGLSEASRRGLVEAHTFGLPLVSGKRSGGGSSDHDHGDAIDVADIPIGAAGSTEGSPKMKAFAEHMRQQGKAGKLDVKYVIADGRIASATQGWEWRPYTYPGKSAAELEALKQSNRGEYNRIQHYDHVHVSFN